ncbi:MAG: tetratricopeptide repeat protein [Sphingobacteriales bacterium]|nr:MAG: tetratricopeptide repeat protein [Sphingobacteriales bacterium]
MKKLLFLTAIVGLLFSACSSGGSGSAADLSKKVTEAENAFAKNSSKILDPSLAKTAIEAYEAYATALPNDDKTPMYLFKSAEMHRSIREYDKAIAIYDEIQTKYKNFEKAPHSLFLTAFTYENDLKELDKAKAAYELFLSTYPEHELADDVQFSLANLGKSPDDIIKAFTSKNNPNTPADSTAKK